MTGIQGISKNLNRLIEKTKRVLAAHPKVLFAYLFGGLARGTSSPSSDIDVAVFIDDSTDLVSEKQKLLGDLIDSLRTDEIDLVLLNTAPLPLKARVIRNNEILIDRKPYLRHAFESLVLREYFDFSVIEEAILKRRFSIG